MIVEALGAIAGIQEGIEGIERAYPATELVTDINQFPGFVNIFGDGGSVDHEYRPGMLVITYPVAMLLLMTKDLQELTHARMVALYGSVVQAFAGRMALGLPGLVDWARITEARPGFITYAGIEYLGIRFVLTVRERVSIDFRP